MASKEETDADAEIRRLKAELKQRDDDLYWKEQELEFSKKRRASSQQNNAPSVVRNDRSGEAQRSVAGGPDVPMGWRVRQRAIRLDPTRAISHRTAARSLARP